MMQADQPQSEAMQQFIQELRAQTGAEAFYIFWSQQAGSSSKSDPSRRPRTLVAFPSADAAIAFAQRNRLTAGGPPRLRRLSLSQLIQVVLREPTIAGLLFVAPDDEVAVAGQFPTGVLLAREAVIARVG